MSSLIFQFKIICQIVENVSIFDLPVKVDRKDQRISQLEEKVKILSRQTTPLGTPVVAPPASDIFQAVAVLEESGDTVA